MGERKNFVTEFGCIESIVFFAILHNSIGLTIVYMPGFKPDQGRNRHGEINIVNSAAFELRDYRLIVNI